jgi:simple sugar transport system ATP-binding protein
MVKDLDIRCTSTAQHAGALSGGNQQKVCLGKALTLDPELLLVSEPTRGIDIGAKAEIQRLMLEMCGEGVSVIFISSELDEIIRCSNRIIIMRDRQKVAELKGENCTQEKILAIIAEGAAAAGGEAQ